MRCAEPHGNRMHGCVIRTAGPPVGRGQGLPKGPVLFPRALPAGEIPTTGDPPASALLTGDSAIYVPEVTPV